MFNNKVDFNMKRVDKFIVNFLMVTLNIFAIMGMLAVFTVPLLMALPEYLKNLAHISIKHTSFLEINLILILSIIVELKNIVGRIKKDKVFLYENADGFVKIGIYVFLFGVVRQINYIVNGHYGTLFRFDNDGNLDIDVFIFIIVACVSFVISEVLRKAVKIKNENDLTI
ncbi:hypothetical protein CLRAG_17970 [Clostridium ragsdalei P11]|uniref:DUF2975 domain-containing protein n=1 Tax=Clostridium ragsdalei P11 TaxID=1353534 RepID=A0A1A6AUY6_9CLOT|nr:DUF2975 domain-containing protein [Clostridium ragsdalei]OBR93894.1 hypothetical protein CLRAG_17970 [Clostridium ragsdalei P11]